MLSSENNIKDRILEDAILTALHFKKIIDIQKGVIIALAGIIAFLLCREV